MSITLNTNHFFPKIASSPDDQEAAERAYQFSFGLFAHPIFSKTGDYPPLVRQIVDQNSAKEGRVRSRLPRFSEDEMNQLKGNLQLMM